MAAKFSTAMRQSIVVFVSTTLSIYLFERLHRAPGDDEFVFLGFSGNKLSYRCLLFVSIVSIPAYGCTCVQLMWTNWHSPTRFGHHRHSWMNILFFTVFFFSSFMHFHHRFGCNIIPLPDYRLYHWHHFHRTSSEFLFSHPSSFAPKHPHPHDTYSLLYDFAANSIATAMCIRR